MQTRDEEEIFYDEDDKTLEPFAHRSWGCSIPGSLDGTLSSLSQWKMSLLVAGVLDYMTFKEPFQSKLFSDSKLSQVVFGMRCVGLAVGFSSFQLWAVSPKLHPQLGSRSQKFILINWINFSSFFSSCCPPPSPQPAKLQKKSHHNFGSNSTEEF